MNSLNCRERGTPRSAAICRCRQARTTDRRDDARPARVRRLVVLPADAEAQAVVTVVRHHHRRHTPRADADHPAPRVILIREADAVIDQLAVGRVGDAGTDGRSVLRSSKGGEFIDLGKRAGQRASIRTHAGLVRLTPFQLPVCESGRAALLMVGLQSGAQARRRGNRNFRCGLETVNLIVRVAGAVGFSRPRDRVCPGAVDGVQPALVQPHASWGTVGHDANYSEFGAMVSIWPA